MHYALSGDTRLVSRCVGLAPTKKPPLYRQGTPPGTTIRMASGWHLVSVSYTHLDVYKRQERERERERHERVGERD